MTILCSGCAPRGSSFETLGVPTVDDLGRDAAIVVGWAQEDRDGWMLRQVRVDGRARQEWDTETQRPVAIVLEPGATTVQLYARREIDGRARRGLKVRPLSLDLAEGQVRLCVVNVRNDGRRRPRMRCSVYAGPDDERTANAKRETDATPRQEPVEARRNVESPSTGADDETIRSIVARLERIEERLRALVSTSEDRNAIGPRGARPAHGTKLDIDTEFPWSDREAVPPRDRFERRFEQRPDRDAARRRR